MSGQREEKRIEQMVREGDNRGRSHLGAAEIQGLWGCTYSQLARRCCLLALCASIAPEARVDQAGHPPNWLSKKVEYLPYRLLTR